MVTLGRVITGFLDKRYTDEGTEITPSEMKAASAGHVGMLNAAVAKEREFKTPTKPSPKTVKIQYKAKVEDVHKIEAHLRKPGMGGSEVGRYTFNYFLKNEVRGEE